MIRRLAVLLIAVAAVLPAAEPLPTLDQGGRLHLVPGAPPIRPGLGTLMTVDAVLGRDADARVLERVVARPWIAMLALTLTWEELEPAPGRWDMDLLPAILARVEAAAHAAGHAEAPWIFLKLLPNPPAWAASSATAAASLEAGRNRLGMQVVRLPPWRDASGRQVAGRESPVSTDPVYRQQLVRLLGALDRALAAADPGAERIPLIQYLGPAMNHFQMRPPLADADGRWFPGQGDDGLGLGWSKAGHLAAWTSLAADMGRCPAIARRLWIYNATYLPPAGAGGGLTITVEEQSAVLAAIEAAHPLGAPAVLLKTESLCADFDAALDGSGTALAPRAGPSPGRWRDRYRSDTRYAPYRWIAERRLRHGWEIWGGFSPRRDRRAASNYPLGELIGNALFRDLDRPAPADWQGTLFVCLWPQEAARAEDIPRLDGGSPDLVTTFAAWDGAIRQGVAALASKDLP